MQLAREGSPPPGLRLPQTELSRKSNQVARARIRQFESYMPSHAVGLQQPNATRSMASPFACLKRTKQSRCGRTPHSHEVGLLQFHGPHPELVVQPFLLGVT
jgi:hypothetical protein